MILKARIGEKYHFGWEEQDKMSFEVFEILLNDLIESVE